MKIEVGILSDTYDLYVNGALVAENVKFRVEAEIMDTVALVENKGGEMFEVYNFRVKE